MATLSSQQYTPTEEAEIKRWLSVADELRSQDARQMLNSHLASRTTLLGSKPSRADVAVYEVMAPVVAAWSAEERSGQDGMPHVVRHVDYVQNAPVFDLKLDAASKVAVDCDDVRHVEAKSTAATAKAKKGEEDSTLVHRTKTASSSSSSAEKPAAGKKEKPPKQQKPPPAAAPLSPSLIDLRVGRILKAINHPDADSLYVSTIAMGDPESDDTVTYEGLVCRTVCSGLNGLIPLAEMQGRDVVVVCNLKPVKMRGIKSSAMVLAASPPGDDDHKGPVELVSPPQGAKPGQRLFFEGWKGEPEGQLNPKKKIWEMFQPAFTTNDSREVTFDAGRVEQLGKPGVGRLVAEEGGVCTVKSLKGAVVR
ncbi:hypothetical protein L249_3976 [Ophiocordyceps polyrhachis-furcata BCC 54312]|uniref:tRNA-binding domain-containing protein n=1 Tax=Ophiocordyceps polyrhachis-furcata BCC 54312 TaxID=1330021 RepID=A0A367L5J8_9HYPO|nr:hypothetical protein L249_3976 [Ophiocordyceps polyrhachis-furcata BCC 54312]